MDFDELQCGICNRQYANQPDLLPRLLLEVGISYCNSCLQGILDKSAGQEYFFVEEEPETEVTRYDRAEQYPKNQTILKLLAKMSSKQSQSTPQAAPPMQHRPSLASRLKKETSSTNVTTPTSSTPTAGNAQSMCPKHKKLIEIVCIDCKERICSNCALFGNHRGHDIKEEAMVLDEINIRQEALSELYKLVHTSASSKPDEQLVLQINVAFKKKAVELKQKLKEKFKQMRNILVVQEQTTEAILSKNLSYIEKELKALQSIDYKMYNDAEKWMKNAKVKLDNFEQNASVPNFIAFDLLPGAKNANPEEEADGDDLLLNEPGEKNNDIIVYGESISDSLCKLKKSDPHKLQGQLENLDLVFNEQTIENLNNCSECICVEGVQISSEEIDALKEAANAKASAMGGVEEHVVPPVEEIAALESQMSAMSIGSKHKVLQSPASAAKPVMHEDPQSNPAVMNFQNPVEQEVSVEEALDPEFLGEIEVYLMECKDNNEPTIDMSDTLIMDQGAKLVGAAASFCLQLQELRLSQCGITDEGAISIFTELCGHPSLQLIDISCNAIGERSLDSLTALMNACPKLVVNMRMNNIKNKFAIRKMQNFESMGRLSLQNS